MPDTSSSYLGTLESLFNDDAASRRANVERNLAIDNQQRFITQEKQAMSRLGLDTSNYGARTQTPPGINPTPTQNTPTITPSKNPTGFTPSGPFGGGGGALLGAGVQYFGGPVAREINRRSGEFISQFIPSDSPLIPISNLLQNTPQFITAPLFGGIPLTGIPITPPGFQPIEPTETPQFTQNEPPFNGGQSFGVSYRVSYTYTHEVWTGVKWDSRNGSGSTIVSGRITAIGWGVNPASASDTTRRYYSVKSVAANGVVSYVDLISFNAVSSRGENVSVSINRVDGKPDTGGNPPPASNSPSNRTANPPVTLTPNGNPGNFTPPGTAPTGNPGPGPSPTTKPGNNPGPSPSPGTQPPDDPDNPYTFTKPDPLDLLPLGLVPFLLGGGGLFPGGSNKPGNTGPYTPPSPGTPPYTNPGQGPGPAPSPSPSPSPNQPPTGTDPNPPNVQCRYFPALDEKISATQDMQGQILTLMNTVQLVGIDNKLGPQLANGGISGFLGRLWNNSIIQKILTYLTFVAVVHNAMMLSNGIKQTLFAAFDNVLQIFDYDLKNDQGQDVDTNTWFNNQVDALLSSIFGESTVDGWQLKFKAFSRIYQAAANLMNSLQNIMFTIGELLETTSQYVARIGNAAIKYGVFAENAYRWMNPNLTFPRGKLQNMLYNVSEVAEALEEISANVLEITETVQEMQNQKSEFQAAVSAAEDAFATGETAKKASSQSPTIEKADLNKPDV